MLGADSTILAEDSFIVFMVYTRLHMENIQEKPQTTLGQKTEAVPDPPIQPVIPLMASSPKLSFFTKRMKIFILLMMGIIAVGGVIAGYGVINIMQSSSLANSSSVPKLTAPLFKLNDLPELPFSPH